MACSAVSACRALHRCKHARTYVRTHARTHTSAHIHARTHVRARTNSRLALSMNKRPISAVSPAYRAFANRHSVSNTRPNINRTFHRVFGRTLHGTLPIFRRTLWNIPSNIMEHSIQPFIESFIGHSIERPGQYVIKHHGTFDRTSWNIRPNIMEHSTEHHGTFDRNTNE